MKLELNFINTSDKLPAYGAPVMIIYKNTLQHITYTLEGADDVPDWFEPYHFDHDNELKMNWNEVSSWSYLPEVRE